ncbi:MAG: hypothetical protein KW788_02010 [Candidatus Doudnabacteria bacterium]|nr:hypothetical protein [Candidatus Doudnabacteria bacterium]
MQLTKGMYGHQFRNASRMYGLSCGQMRGDDMVHNGGWYNAAGEKLGWGDLSRQDFERISSEIEEGEIFVVLYEGDAFWKFVTHNPGIIGSMCKTRPDAEAPGVDYVAQKAAWIITRGKVFHVSDYSERLGPETHRRNGMAFELTNRSAANTLIRTTALRYGKGAETIM